MIILAALLSCGLFTTAVSEEQCSNVPKSAAIRLKAEVFCGYDATVRPTKLHTGMVNVSIFLWLKHFQFEEYYNVLYVFSWTVWMWKDEHLVWDPSRYEGVDEMRVDSDGIWVPDVALYTMSDMGSAHHRMPSTNCVVNSKGEILCVPPTTYSAQCVSDLRLWPFDKQQCDIKLGSWSHTETFLNLSLHGNGVSTYDYEGNREWELKSITAVRFVTVFGNDSFPYLQYSMSLQRHAQGHAATVVVPALILSLLTLVSLWLEPGCPERLTIGCMNALAHCLYIQYLGFTLPNNGDVTPCIVVFFRDSMLLVGMSLLVAVVTRSMVSTARVPPGWLHTGTSWVLDSRPGQILMLQQEPQNVASAEDGSGLVTTTPDAAGPEKEWRRIAILLDRVCFLLFAITVFILLIAFVP